MKTKTGPRYIAVLPDPQNVSEYIVDCQIIVEKMTNNPSFPNPIIPMAQVSGHIDILATDEAAARKGGKGAVQKRDASLAVVHGDMRLLKAFVQVTADGLSPADAKTAIMSAGMGVSQNGTWHKDAVAAKRGDVPCRVVLDAKALPRPAVYRWQMSTDGEAWSDLPETFKARTTVDGLVPRTVYYFRLRTMTPDGLSDWSQIVSVVAL